jgi:thioredoxin reductase
MKQLLRRVFIKQRGLVVAAGLLPFSSLTSLTSETMTNDKQYDVIIVGGSYAGLAAGMSLGRAMRSVLIMDEGRPCNRQTPYSHNFLTNDGKKPAEIAALGRLQVSNYPTVDFFDGRAVHATKTAVGYTVEGDNGKSFNAKKLVFATGIKDLLPAIEGVAECWGISVIHCPFCHGYEVRHEKTAILANGEAGFDFTRLIANWTNDLTLLTNGPAVLTAAQKEQLLQLQVPVIEKEIDSIDHTEGQINTIAFKDGSRFSPRALYAPSPFEQHCKLPEELGCALTGEGYLQTDPSYETTVPGIYAIGDNASRMRTVANAVAMGNAVGIGLSKKLILEAN